MKSVGEVVGTRGWLSTAALGWCFVLAVCPVLLVLLFSRTQAQAHEAMLRFGAQAMAFPGSTFSEPRRLAVNGIAVSFRTEVVDASLTETLEHYQRVCMGGAQTQHWYGSLLSSLATRSASRDDDGYVACVHIDSWELSSLAARIARFADSLDLSDLGAPRYVYASRAHERSDRRTFVLTFWSDGPFSLRNLLPVGRADAPGADPRGIPRPEGSQRILSATEVSERTALFSYWVPNRTPKEVEREYRNVLSRDNWRVIERNGGETIRIDGAHMLSAERDQRLVTVITHRSARGETVVTLLDWTDA